MSNLPYSTPCEVRPNRDRVIDTEVICDTLSLWIVEFSIKDVGNGCAVIKAKNAKTAESMLRTQGSFNAYPHLYNITRIEEIIPSPDSMLIAEQIAVNSIN